MKKSEPENKACACLFCNGNAMYFDERGDQIVALQKKRLCGLHEFVRWYPDAPVYWAAWERGELKWAQEIPKEAIPWLLRCIRRKLGPGIGAWFVKGGKDETNVRDL